MCKCGVQSDPDSDEYSAQWIIDMLERDIVHIHGVSELGEYSRRTEEALVGYLEKYKKLLEDWC